MVPAGAPTEDTIAKLGELLQGDDVVIDGGNSFYQDDIRRAAALRQKGIHYLDVGTSGGVFGLERGFCLMIGGDRAVAQRLDPIFATMAPGDDGVRRTPGRDGPRRPRRARLCVLRAVRCRPLRQDDPQRHRVRHDAGLCGGPRHPAQRRQESLPAERRYDFDLAEITEVWRHGSVISSWLLDLTAAALAENQTLSNFSGVVQDSGEGRWTVNAAIEEAVPAEVLTAALYARFRSRQEHTFAERVLSAMRFKFGGHVEPGHKP